MNAFTKRAHTTITLRPTQTEMFTWNSICLWSLSGTYTHDKWFQVLFLEMQGKWPVTPKSVGVTSITDGSKWF